MHSGNGLPGRSCEFSLVPEDIPESQSPQRLLITRDEAAAILSISPRKLWSLTNAGVIPCVRLGKCVRYSPIDLQAWILEQRR
jgi:excisionase family DNA binding protein